MAEELQSLEPDRCFELQRDCLRIVAELSRVPSIRILDPYGIVGLYSLCGVRGVFRTSINDLVVQARVAEPLVLVGASHSSRVDLVTGRPLQLVL